MPPWTPPERALVTRVCRGAMRWTCRFALAAAAALASCGAPAKVEKAPEDVEIDRAVSLLEDAVPSWPRENACFFGWMPEVPAVEKLRDVSRGEGHIRDASR